MKNRSHFTAPFLVNNQLLEGIAAKVLKDFEAKNKTTGSQLLAKPSAKPSHKPLDERPWDRAGVGAETLSNQQKQSQLSSNCFRSEEDLPVATSSAGATSKELDSLRKVVLGDRGRAQKEVREEELREQKERKEEKKRTIDDANSKMSVTSLSTAHSVGAPAKKGTPSLLELEMAKKKKKKGQNAPQTAPTRERVVEMAEGADDYEEETRETKKSRSE